MAISTTLHISNDILSCIDRACAKTGISRSILASSALRLIMNKHSIPANHGTAVRYQKRASPETWNILHVRFGNNEYEFFTDMRKVLKMSVSLLLAYAVALYYDEIIGIDNNEIKGDNYHFFRHVLSTAITQTGICWKLNWVKTRHPMKN